jgi:hypothetical protein
MSRFRSSGSYTHRLKRMGRDWFRLYWTVDHYYPGDRLRYPRGHRRDTDFAGARRFAKKWGLPEPTDEDS